MLGVIAGFDEMDPTTIDMPVPDYTAALKMRVSKLRLGLPRADFFEKLQPGVWQRGRRRDRCSAETDGERHPG
jgi:aspartyl-tRNA(Asn)/glutamyl-tRNA(Gln) amidotransferase subunit A